MSERECLLCGKRMGEWDDTDVDAQTWDVVADGIRALMAERDALALDKSVVLDQLRDADEWCERDANVIVHREFMAAGWRRLAEDKRDDAWAWMRAHNEAALARDAALANAEAVLLTADAMRVERDRMRDYWRSEAEMRGACLVEIDQLRAKVRALANDIEAALASRQSKGLTVAHELDAVPVSALRHIQRQLKAALATYEEG